MYHDLQVPFNIFIECVVNNRYDLLIIEGEPTTEQTGEAWQSIYEKYIDAIGDNETKIRLENVKEVAMLEGRINLSNLIINQLKISYSQELADLLLQFDYPLNLEPTNDNIDTFIKQFTGFLNSDVLDLQEKIKLLKKKEGKSEPITRQYFEKIIVAIEISFKLPINLEKITTAKYCEYVNSYNEHIKNLQNKIKK